MHQIILQAWTKGISLTFSNEGGKALTVSGVRQGSKIKHKSNVSANYLKDSVAFNEFLEHFVNQI